MANWLWPAAIGSDQVAVDRLRFGKTSLKTTGKIRAAPKAGKKEFTVIEKAPMVA